MLFGTDGIKYVRRPINERFNPKYHLPTVKHGGGNFMVWGCFSRDSIGPIQRIEGIMDQVMYKGILKDTMLPHAKNQMPRGWIFQDDNDPKHTAKSVKEFLATEKVRLLEWPSQSPDLNPIEHLWEHLDRQLTGRKPSNKDDLFEKMKVAWNEIPLDVVINLVDSMPRPCQAVINARGYPTKY
jgi:DDE superfamily endonuclease